MSPSETSFMDALARDRDQIRLVRGEVSAILYHLRREQATATAQNVVFAVRHLGEAAEYLDRAIASSVSAQGAA